MKNFIKLVRILMSLSEIPSAFTNQIRVNTFHSNEINLALVKIFMKI